MQLCVLGQAPGFAKLKARVVEIASALEERSNVPAIREHLAFIEEIQTDGWWRDVTAGMLEGARRRLRGLVHLIEKRARKAVYTDFEDEIGEGTVFESFGGLAAPDTFEKSRAKARRFLRGRQDHVAVHKLRTNRQLTPTDLEELESVLRDGSVGTPEDIERAKADAEGLGLFVRSLVGMARAAAKEAFAGFLRGRSPTANQIEVVDMVIDHLTENGVMDAGRLYEPPYTERSPLGIDGLFESDAVDEVVAILDEVGRKAAA